METLEKELTNLVAQCESEPQEWKPQIFDLSQVTDQGAMEQLIENNPGLRCFDQLRSQLAELIETRHPGDDFSSEELQAAIDQHIGYQPYFEYGCWVYYPWSGRLVHVLPEDEFRELRTSRNRNKITEQEQHKLRQLRLGIVGLSVGQATAVTLALEEIGGEYLLADFDTLDLSNMNRLRAGVYDLGLNKAYVTARQIYEFNPYARIEVFTDGITKENIDRFLREPRKLDMLFEECDDLYMKVLLREKARALNIPVLMESSDRGMLDVERFDLDPQRPLLHGIIDTLEADKLIGLSTYDKVPIVMKLVDSSKISGRMAASMVEVGSTLKTWPQLASAVALGGALNVDSARRIALGEFNSSGRYYIDVESIVTDGADASVEKTPDFNVEISEQALNIQFPKISTANGQYRKPSCEQIRTIVTYAAAAPSGGNCQPWKFVWNGNELLCFHDVKRSLSFLDYAHRASYMSIGSAVENLTIAAHEMGFAVKDEIFPDPNDLTHVCSLTFHPISQTNGSDGLFEQITRRCTNRRLGKRSPLQKSELETLYETAHYSNARLQLIVTDNELDEIAKTIGEGDRFRFAHRQMHEELMKEIRWNKAETEATRDGIDVATLEFSPTDLAGMRLISSWTVMDLVGKFGAGRGLMKPTKKSIAAASAVGLLTFQGRTPRDWYKGGRAIERFWLCATQLELALQPMTALTYVFERLRCGGDGLTSEEQAIVGKIRQRYLQLYEVNDDESEIMLFRLARTGPPSARSLRRHTDDILSIELN